MNRPESYTTKQKVLVERCLLKNCDRHLTVENITELLKADGFNVGRTTVYRTLEALRKAGRVRKFSVDRKEGCCFQYVGDSSRCHEHFHIKCNVCGELMHVECDHMDKLSSHMLSEHGFTLDFLQTVLYGTCAKCAEK